MKRYRDDKIFDNDVATSRTMVWCLRTIADLIAGGYDVRALLGAIDADDDTGDTGVEAMRLFRDYSGNTAHLDAYAYEVFTDTLARLLGRRARSQLPGNEFMILLP